MLLSVRSENSFGEGVESSSERCICELVLVGEMGLGQELMASVVDALASAVEKCTLEWMSDMPALIRKFDIDHSEDDTWGPLEKATIAKYSSTVASLLGRASLWDKMSNQVSDKLKPPLETVSKFMKGLSSGAVSTLRLVLPADTITAEMLTMITNLSDPSSFVLFVQEKKAQGHPEVESWMTEIIKFFSRVLAPKAVANLDTRSSLPTENLKRLWQVAVDNLRTIEKFAASKTVNDELLKALQTLGDDKASHDLNTLSQAVSTPLQGLRSQVLSKVLTSATMIGTMLPKILSIEEDFNFCTSTQPDGCVGVLGHMQTAARLLDSWIRGSCSSFSEINEGWFGDAHECTRIRALIDSLVVIGKDWGRSSQV